MSAKRNPGWPSRTHKSNAPNARVGRTLPCSRCIRALTPALPRRGFTDTGELFRVRGIFHYFTGGAMVTLPLLSRNQGTVAAAQAERAGAASEVEAARLRAQAELAAARARDGHARRALEAYGTEAIPLATRNLETVIQTYELGRATLLDVVAEQRRYLELQRAYTEVLREAYQARQALKQALGETR